MMIFIIFNVLVVILIISALIKRKEVKRIWSNVTNKVVWYLTWFHIKNQLPEDLEGPFGWRGGGKQTITLSSGERPEFVVVPPTMSLFFQWQPRANPGEETRQPLGGAPPLFLWLFVLPTTTLFLSLMIQELLWLLGASMETDLFASMWLNGMLAELSILFAIPIYWLYEFQRRNTRIIATNLRVFIVTVEFVRRAIRVSLTPMKNITEPIVTSLNSDRSGCFSVFVGGLLHEMKDAGNVFFGTWVRGASDLLQFFPSVSAIDKIIMALVQRAKAFNEEQEYVRKAAMTARYDGVAKQTEQGTAFASSVSGQVPPIVQAQQKAAALMGAWSDKVGGEQEPLNLFDPRLYGWEGRWDLITGEERNPEEV